MQNEETKEYLTNEKTGQKPRKKELNDTEISNLSDQEFEVIVIKMFTELGDNFNKEIEKYKKEQIRTEEYNNYNGKHTRGNEEQIGGQIIVYLWGKN